MSIFHIHLGEKEKEILEQEQNRFHENQEITAPFFEQINTLSNALIAEEEKVEKQNQELCDLKDLVQKLRKSVKKEKKKKKKK